MELIKQNDLLVFPNRLALFFETFDAFEHIFGFHQGIQKKLADTFNGLWERQTQVLFDRLFVQSNDQGAVVLNFLNKLIGGIG